MTTLDWEDFSGRDDPAQRFRIYALCTCSVCGGRGKLVGLEIDDAEADPEPTQRVYHERCPECRGEGRVRDLKATAGTPEAVGVALVTLAREGEFTDDAGDPCPLGLLDVAGEVGQKWLVRPFLPSPRNVSDAGRVLASAHKRK